MKDIMQWILYELIVYNPVNKKVRYGRRMDGGYVIVDGYDYDLFISCGIGKDVSFEVDFCKNHKINGFAFDGTVDDPGLPDDMIFIKKNITKNNDLNDYVKNYKNVFIKMDIERAEWEWIRNFNYFSKVKQIVFEAHHTYTSGALDCLRKLNETHSLVHVSQNNNGKNYEHDGKVYPSLIELTYLRKEIDGLNKTRFPIDGIDFKNIPSKPELILDIWPFKS